jgi:phospho-N-acetylmuramoyl-pentapeptide-transferase
MLTGIVIGAVDEWKKRRACGRQGLAALSKALGLATGALIEVHAWHWLFSALASRHASYPIFVRTPEDCAETLWIALVALGSTNAVNLTDGLDGLAAGPILVSLIWLVIICYLSGDLSTVRDFNLSYAPGARSLCLPLGVLIGAVIGFAWHNTKPAKVMMGDTGALAIGGALGYVALFTRQELLFALVGGVFVLETVSVVLQVIYFKLTKKRIFLMAPLHHHLEMKGWSQTTIVLRAWLLSILFAISALAIMCYR